MDPRGMVSQPSLGFAKRVSLTWKYLLGRDSLFSLFFQWEFCCNSHVGPDPFSGEGLNYTHSLPVTVKGRLLMSLLLLTAAYIHQLKNLHKIKFTFKHRKKTPLGPPLSLSALTLFDLYTASDSLTCKHRVSDLWKCSWSFKYERCSPSP